MIQVSGYEDQRGGGGGVFQPFRRVAVVVDEIGGLRAVFARNDGLLRILLSPVTVV